MTDYKTLLEKKHISASKIAAALNLSKGTVSLILNDKYQGNDVTKKKVIEHIKFVLIDKEDLNQIIYTNADVFGKALNLALRNLKAFTDDEAEKIIEVSLKIRKHKKFLEQSKSQSK